MSFVLSHVCWQVGQRMPTLLNFPFSAEFKIENPLCVAQSSPRASPPGDPELPMGNPGGRTPGGSGCPATCFPPSLHTGSTPGAGGARSQPGEAEQQFGCVFIGVEPHVGLEVVPPSSISRRVPPGDELCGVPRGALGWLRICPPRSWQKGLFTC